jgi:hypothetical protein
MVNEHPSRYIQCVFPGYTISDFAGPMEDKKEIEITGEAGNRWEESGDKKAIKKVTLEFDVHGQGNGLQISITADAYTWRLPTDNEQIQRQSEIYFADVAEGISRVVIFVVLRVASTRIPAFSRLFIGWCGSRVSKKIVSHLGRQKH